jgi:hypothetical protein
VACLMSEVSMKVVNVQARCLNIPIKFFTETPRTEGMPGPRGDRRRHRWCRHLRDAERFAVRELIHQEIALSPREGPWRPRKSERCLLGNRHAYKVRTGVVARAIGAADQALWDIKGNTQPAHLPAAGRRVSLSVGVHRSGLAGTTGRNWSIGPSDGAAGIRQAQMQGRGRPRPDVPVDVNG